MFHQGIVLAPKHAKLFCDEPTTCWPKAHVGSWWDGFLLLSSRCHFSIFSASTCFGNRQKTSQLGLGNQSVLGTQSRFVAVILFLCLGCCWCLLLLFNSSKQIEINQTPCFGTQLSDERLPCPPSSSSSAGASSSSAKRKPQKMKLQTNAASWRYQFHEFHKGSVESKPFKCLVPNGSTRFASHMNPGPILQFCSGKLYKIMLVPWDCQQIRAVICKR